MRSGNRRGFTLLEALVALLVLSVAGVAMAEATSQAMHAVRHAALEERAVADLDRLLTAYSLLDRRDLEQRLGTEVVGAYRVRVSREGFDLYVVGVGRDQAANDLITVFYRPAGGS